MNKNNFKLAKTAADFLLKIERMQRNSLISLLNNKDAKTDLLCAGTKGNKESKFHELMKEYMKKFGYKGTGGWTLLVKEEILKQILIEHFGKAPVYSYNEDNLRFIFEEALKLSKTRYSYLTLEAHYFLLFICIMKYFNGNGNFIPVKNLEDIAVEYYVKQDEDEEDEDDEEYIIPDDIISVKYDEETKSLTVLINKLKIDNIEIKNVDEDSLLKTKYKYDWQDFLTK